ncbi:hypothetical protein [Egbenema bharatensis]|uniref:hypothetical protein n=1 Tax=Egbenema bharatensis TaxID=3463334 RepID=UPI003A852696
MSINAIEPAVDLAATSVLPGPLQAALTPLQLTQADANAFLEDVALSIREASGTLSFENGILTSNVTSPLGELIGTFNLVELVTDLATSVEPLTGSFTLEGGTLVGEVSEADELLFGGTFQVTQLVNDALTAYLPQISGTIPFADGAFLVDLSTPFGDVSGTIDFGQGALVSDLTTPFGTLNATIDLGDNAQIPITVDGTGIDLGLAFLPIPASFGALLDLSNGFITADLTSVLPGLVVSLPLSDLSGTITLADGQATVATNTPIGVVESSFEAAPAASSLILPILENASGTLDLAEGQLTTALTTAYGDFAGSLNVVSFLNNFASSLSEVSGTVSIANGILTSNLTTPFGDLIGNFDLNEFLDASTPFSETLTGSLAV